eukprot:CAMPEP_0182461440 /NCGR_PEP_ID=MMETSP1319-20130603/6026_1 /TAXON_ID=172717 /ORGANISM="Bolidomonas pacifica, Strain RCC208" /LENGTH=34 /DNA_ID= /DNA_START= /DNA_END= /DNA_ORIENTATION=
MTPVVVGIVLLQPSTHDAVKSSDAVLNVGEGGRK